MNRLLLAVSVIFVTGSRGSSARSSACEDGDIRLAGGPNELEGRLEYCRNSQWGHVCGTGWGRNDGKVACRQLGYESSSTIIFASTISYYGAQEGPAFLNSLQCVGTETTLGDCTNQVLSETGCGTQGGFAYLVCSDSTCEANYVRLVGGESNGAGRVEVCDSSGFRRQVCDDNWDQQDATVVCRSLGFQSEIDPMLIVSYQLTTVRLPAYSIDCSGSERHLTNCSFSQIPTFPNPMCDDYAGVNCLGIPVSDVTLTSSSLLSMTISSPVFTVLPISTSETISKRQPQASPTFSPMPLPTVPEPLDNTLLFAVLGSMGGVIVILLISVIVLFAIIIQVRNRYKRKATSIINNSEGAQTLDPSVINSTDAEYEMVDFPPAQPPRHEVLPSTHLSESTVTHLYEHPDNVLSQSPSKEDAEIDGDYTPMAGAPSSVYEIVPVVNEAYKTFEEATATIDGGYTPMAGAQLSVDEIVPVVNEAYNTFEEATATIDGEYTPMAGAQLSVDEIVPVVNEAYVQTHTVKQVRKTFI